MWSELTLAFRRKYIRFTSATGLMRLKLLLRAVWYFPLLFFSAAAALALTALFEILDPLLKVRIRMMVSDRIGTLAYLPDVYLRHRATYGRPKGELDLIVSDKPANRQLMTVIKRKTHVLEYPFLFKIYRIVRIFMKDSKVWDRLPVRINGFKLFNETPPQLSFVEEEIKKGQEELLRMGIRPGEPFVCFHSRDKAYLDKAHSYYSRQQWAYHDYRDSDIRNYLPTAEYIASLEMFAIRMGCIVEHPIGISNPRIIDYSTHYRSDFMDIYLLGNCKFFLGCNAGLHSVAQAFGIPVAAANWIPIKDILLPKHDVFIPMKLWSIEKKRFLTFREIITSGIQDFVRSEEYAKAGVEVLENTADEILALAKEMNARIDNTWTTIQEDEELQQRYRSLFPPGHICCRFQSRVGAEFLRQNKELLE